MGSRNRPPCLHIQGLQTCFLVSHPLSSLDHLRRLPQHLHRDFELRFIIYLKYNPKSNHYHPQQFRDYSQAKIHRRRSRLDQRQLSRLARIHERCGRKHRTHYRRHSQLVRLRYRANRLPHLVGHFRLASQFIYQSTRFHRQNRHPLLRFLLLRLRRQRQTSPKRRQRRYLAGRLSLLPRRYSSRHQILDRHTRKLNLRVKLRGLPHFLQYRFCFTIHPIRIANLRNGFIISPPACQAISIKKHKSLLLFLAKQLP